MSAGWVAGNVRARGMLKRRLGARRARELALSGSLVAAQRLLGETVHQPGIVAGQALAETEYRLGANLLWQLRVLAGWQPRSGVAIVRTLAGGFDIADIVAHARMLAGATPVPVFELGALSVAWSRVRRTDSLAELRSVLAGSVWGDPGSDTPADIATGIRLTSAHRIATAVPEAARWAVGDAALLVARHQLLDHRPLTRQAADTATKLLGRAAIRARDWDAFQAALPARARWVTADLTELDQLWRAEFRWWSQVEQEGLELLRRPGFGPAATIGAVAALSFDAWKARATIQFAATGATSPEVYDALV
ncbi:hypothetical protein [Nocardia sp. NPDC049707]|uniref:hypothetical protein n=1 Tax=Nocardia sp. NPDC049707 TaxID=3154735 RepID=UPI003435CD09